MKLKIKIKEVKEDVRKLTIEEWAVYLLSVNGNSIFQHDAQDIVKSWGLVECVNGLIALFRTETIRDAAPKEIIAWHCTQIWKPCNMIGCEYFTNCPKKGGCEVISDYKKSMDILNGKEVILELVDE